MACALASAEQLGAVALTLLTSTLIFARRVLVLNAFVWPPRPMQYATWALSLFSGLMFWVSLNALRASVQVQIATGILSTVLAWITYVLLVNDALRYPTRQQRVSLLFHVITEALVLVQVRLVVRACIG